MGTNSQDDPEETRYGGLDKELKDDINKETTAAVSTHGPLGLQRLPDLTGYAGGVLILKSHSFKGTIILPDIFPLNCHTPGEYIIRISSTCV